MDNIKINSVNLSNRTLLHRDSYCSLQKSLTLQTALEERVINNSGTDILFKVNYGTNINIKIIIIISDSETHQSRNQALKIPRKLYVPHQLV